MAQLHVGDVVIRSHRLLKTRGTVVRVASQRRGEVRQVWIKWNHADTFPNPSLETADSLEVVERSPATVGSDPQAETRPVHPLQQSPPDHHVRDGVRE